MAAPRRAATVFCSFEGCDVVARATIGASAFCPLHHAAITSMLDRGSAPQPVESTPVESGDVPERPTGGARDVRGTR
jgi:hypothetical protein